MALKAYVGDLGSGKTAMMTYDAFIDWSGGRKIYANYNLKFPHEKVYFDNIYKQMTTSFSNSHVLLDEGWIFFDARRSGSKANLLMNQFLLQSRKLDVDISATAQTFMQFDKRFRQHCDYLIECNNRGNLVYFKLHNRKKNTQKKGVVDISVIWDLYDTNQIITPEMAVKK